MGKEGKVKKWNNIILLSIFPLGEACSGVSPVLAQTTNGPKAVCKSLNIGAPGRI
jgi:hypothetical protein